MSRRKLMISLLLCLLSTFFGCATLVFTREDDSVLKIFRMNQDGTGAHLFSPSGPSVFSYPDVSKDGKKIAYTDGQEVFISNFGDVGGASQMRLSTPPGRKAFTRWSPDQQVIAYALFSPTGQASIWLSAANGSAPLRVTYPQDSQSDGEGHDFYLSDAGIPYLVHGRNGSLYSMFFNGTQPAVEIVSGGISLHHDLPVVSHNNRLLAFRVVLRLMTGTIEAIEVVDVGTWTSRYSIFMPSPPVEVDSISSIAFSRDDSGLFVSAKIIEGSGDRHEIFSIKLDGSHFQRLTSNAIFDSQPDAVPLCRF